MAAGIFILSSFITMRISPLLLVYKHAGHAHSGAHAHTRHSDLLVPSLELREKGYNLSCAGGAERVADCAKSKCQRRATLRRNINRYSHGTASDVDLVDVQAKSLDAIDVL
jgi:hypothetical protein